MPVDTGSPLSAHYQVLPSKDGLYTLQDRIDGQIINISSDAPALAFASNGVPILRVGSNVQGFAHPIKATTHSTFRWGFACWIRPNAFGKVIYISRADGGADLTRLNFQSNSGGVLLAEIYSASDFVGVTYTTAAGALKLNQWQFVRIAFDGAPSSADDRFSILVDEVKYVGTIAAMGGGTMPTRLRRPTGSAQLLRINASSGAASTGDVGSQIMFFDANVTPAQGAFYMQMQRPAA